MISPGTLHEIPQDLEEAFLWSSDVIVKWNALTPLARNEWICRVTIVKKEETRKEHIQRLLEDIWNNKKRPCCWPGCPHHRESAKKWFKGLEIK